MEISKWMILIIGIVVSIFVFPKWTVMIIPKVLGKFEIRGIVKIIIRAIATFLLALLIWSPLKESLNIAYEKISGFFSGEELLSGIPSIITAILTLILVFTFISAVFDNLGTPSNLVESLISVTAIVVAFALAGPIWGLFTEYLRINIDGVKVVMDADPIKEILSFFSSE